MSTRQAFYTNDQITVTVSVPPVTPYNLQPNSNGALGGFGYVTPLAGTRVRRQTGAPPYPVRLRYTTTVTGPLNYFATEAFGVTPGHYVAASWRALTGRSAGRMEFNDAAGTAIEFSATSAVASGAVTVAPYLIPAGATSMRLRVYPYESDGGFIDTTLSHDFAQIRVATAPTAAEIDLANLTPYDNVAISGESIELSLDRSPISTSTLEVVLRSDSLDPAVDDRTLSQGNVCQVLAGGEAIYTGKILEGSTGYNPLAPVGKRARIALTVVDAAAALAKPIRPDGVQTIDELPAVLEGCGVPWRVNGSTSQIGTYTVVARNESASALDQVAITRDTARGYAWVNCFGELIVNDADEMATIALVTIDEHAYLEDGIDIGFDLDTVINEVTVRFRRINPATEETEELLFGPYRDQASIDKRGHRAREFVVQGIDETLFDVEGYAAAVLASNATPRVRVKSVTMTMRTTSDITSFARRDLYDVVNVVNELRDIDQDLRITKIEHRITKDVWKVTLGFEDNGQVAQPQSTPSLPNTGTGQTAAELYRPVGEITMFGAAAVPAGWLVCDGSNFSSDTYPKLATYLGDTHGAHAGTSYKLPNLVDRFPIGAGTKTVGTSGGAPTVQLVKANIPPHKHDMAHTHVVARGTGTGSANRVARGDGSDAGTQTTAGQDPTETGNGSGDGLTSTTPVDVLNPWRALVFAIRAV